jgi:hypothetical protein
LEEILLGNFARLVVQKYQSVTKNQTSLKADPTKSGYSSEPN